MFKRMDIYNKNCNCVQMAMINSLPRQKNNNSFGNMNYKPINKNQAPLYQNMNQAPLSQNMNQAPLSKNMNQAPLSKNMNQAPLYQNMNQAPLSKNMNK